MILLAIGKLFLDKKKYKNKNNMKYKKVTKENFEAFTDKYVSKKGCRIFIGLDMPKNESEFKQFTKAIYGVELGVDCLAYPKGSFTNRDGFEYNCKYKITGMTEVNC